MSRAALKWALEGFVLYDASSRTQFAISGHVAEAAYCNVLVED